DAGARARDCRSRAGEGARQGERKAGRSKAVVRFSRVLVVVLIPTGATACPRGRNYERPSIQRPSTYRSASGQPTAASLADLQWFELFRDDTLNGLIKTALQENFELRIAAQRVLQARAAYGITRAGQWPTVDASADVISARSSQVGANRGIPAGTDTDVSYAQAGFSLSWELDGWGRLRRLKRAAPPR